MNAIRFRESIGDHGAKKDINQNCASGHTCVSVDALMIAVAQVIVATTHFLNYLLGLPVRFPRRKDLIE